MTWLILAFQVQTAAKTAHSWEEYNTTPALDFGRSSKEPQQSDGGWSDEEGEPFKNPTMLMDFGSLEVGFIKFASPPAFSVVPFGQPIPPRPDEMTKTIEGKDRKAFSPGFRLKVYNPKVFGDDDAYYFSNSAKTVMDPMDELHNLFLASPEAAQGKVPVVACTGTRVIENTSSFGTNKFYAPVFEIKLWHERVATFGDRTVPVPQKANGTAQPVAQNACASCAACGATRYRQGACGGWVGRRRGAWCNG